MARYWLTFFPTPLIETKADANPDEPIEKIMWVAELELEELTEGIERINRPSWPIEWAVDLQDGVFVIKHQVTGKTLRASRLYGPEVSTWKYILPANKKAFLVSNTRHRLDREELAAMWKAHKKDQEGLEKEQRVISQTASNKELVEFVDNFFLDKDPRPTVFEKLMEDDLRCLVVLTE